MRRTYVFMAVTLGLLLGACKTAPPGQPTLPGRTDTPTIISTPARTRTAAAPGERLLDFDVPAEIVFVPNQRQDALIFYADRVRRVAVDLSPTDGDTNLNLQVRILDETGEMLPKITALLGEPMLRDEWDLPEPGRYTIQLFGPEEHSRAFTLTLISRPIPEVGGGPIAYGETHSGAIAIRGQRDQWLFSGRAGDQVLITLQAVGSDAYLELYDPQGQSIAHNDDASGIHNAMIDMTLSTDGEYSIIVRMYDDNQTGSYQLALENVP